MKKFFSFLIVAVALVAVSCGGNANKEAEQTEGTQVEVAIDSTDTVKVDTAVVAVDTTKAVK